LGFARSFTKIPTLSLQKAERRGWDTRVATV
jgi:hypothetical protein